MNLAAFSTNALSAARSRLPALWRDAAELSTRIGAAQRCAYAAELGVRPSPRDIALLGLDRQALWAMTRA